MMMNLDTHALLTQGRRITLPAAMEVRLTASPEKVETLELLQTFRFLPGRRLVALVRWKERLVVMKLFFLPAPLDEAPGTRNRKYRPACQFRTADTCAAGLWSVRGWQEWIPSAGVPC